MRDISSGGGEDKNTNKQTKTEIDIDLTWAILTLYTKSALLGRMGEPWGP